MTPEVEARFCGYRGCGEQLVYDGRGRPPEYCPDRRWPDGKTCKQMAAAERAAGRAAGLEVPLDTFRTAGERLASVASPLARQLVEVAEAIGRVQDGALTRMGQAEQAAHDATADAQAAQEAATRAQRAQRTAEADRDQARAAAEDAERRAADARRDAEEQVRRAWQRVAQADHDRGHAEAAAAAAGQALAEEVRRREAAEQRAALAETELRDVRVRLEADRAALGDTRDQLAATRQRADAAEAAEAQSRQLRDQAAQQLGQLARERDELADQRDLARAEAVDTQTRLRTVTGERNAAQAELGQLRQAAAEANRRAEWAETRLDQLIAALPLPPPSPPA